uniref:U296r n=1 Tax=Mycobacterium leprae TaxID=1769 RepID=Q50163_MYCLR|nr:u296r [Mycobacterium leprae]
MVSDQPHTVTLVKLSGNFLLTSTIEAVGEAVALVAKAVVDKLQLTSSPQRCSPCWRIRPTAG